MTPTRLEVIAPVLDGMGICSICELTMHQAQLGESPAERAMGQYPTEWQEEWKHLTSWVFELAGKFGPRLQVRVTDPRSPRGLLKSVRHLVRRYPTWLVNGRVRAVGWDRSALETALREELENARD